MEQANKIKEYRLSPYVLRLRQAEAEAREEVANVNAKRFLKGEKIVLF